jgi:signal transduction histidine kinase
MTIFINGDDLKKPVFFSRELCLVAAFAICMSAVLFVSVALASDTLNEKNQKILVGSELDYPPYALVTEDGQADGFSVDLMKAVLEVMGIKPVFRVGPLSEIKAALIKGDIDALPLVSYSEARDKIFDFTSPHTLGNGIFFKRKESRDINTTNELDGKKIAVMRSDATHHWLTQNNITENILFTKSVSEALRLVAAGESDYAFVSHLVGLLLMQELDLNNIESTGQTINVHGRGYGFAVKEGNSKLLGILNKGLNIVKQTGRYDEIYEKWFGLVDPKGIDTAVIVRYVIWATIIIVILTGLTVTWVVILRRTVNLKTVEIKRAHDQLETRVEERTRSLQNEITERKKVEESLRGTKAAAEKANLAKSEFLASMSHDLRTPLNAIMGFSEMMTERIFGPLGDTHYEEYANYIQDSGRLLISLVDDVLDLSKIEAGKYKLEEKNLDIQLTIQASVKMLTHQADIKKIRLINSSKPSLPKLYGDEKAITQIFNNLLSNAIKFTPENGKITINAWKDGDSRFIIQISDTGIGMSNEDIVKAMNPFEQADSQHSRKHEGTGLGLHLSNRLIELHGGKLTLESNIEHGTKVTVSFPFGRIVTDV